MNISVANSRSIIFTSALILVSSALSKENAAFKNSGTPTQPLALLCKDYHICDKSPYTGPVTPLKAPVPGIDCSINPNGSCNGFVVLDSINGLLVTFRVLSPANKDYATLYKLSILIVDSKGKYSKINAVTADKNVADLFNYNYDVKEFKYVVNKTSNMTFSGPKNNYSVVIDFSPPFSSAK